MQPVPAETVVLFASACCSVIFVLVLVASIFAFKLANLRRSLRRSVAYRYTAPVGGSEPEASVMSGSAPFISDRAVELIARGVDSLGALTRQLGFFNSLPVVYDDAAKEKRDPRREPLVGDHLREHRTFQDGTAYTLEYLVAEVTPRHIICGDKAFTFEKWAEAMNTSNPKVRVEIVHKA